MCATKSFPSCLTLCDPVDCSPPVSSVCGNLQARENTGVGCRALLQGIFLTQGLNPHLFYLLHWQAGSLPLVPPGKPVKENRCPPNLGPHEACEPQSLWGDEMPGQAKRHLWLQDMTKPSRLLSPWALAPQIVVGGQWMEGQLSSILSPSRQGLFVNFILRLSPLGGGWEPQERPEGRKWSPPSPTILSALSSLGSTHG